MGGILLKLILLTPAAGKRLIGKAVAKMICASEAIRTGMVIVVAGTTNAYVAEELLSRIGLSEEFPSRHFFRGITTANHKDTDEAGRLKDDSAFYGDVVIDKGRYVSGKTIEDFIDRVGSGDVIVKGANFVNRSAGTAGILIGHPQGGTIMKAMPAVIGRRARLILPIGLEKRVCENIHEVAGLMNASGASGFRMMPVSGEIITEIEAMKILYGINTRLVAAGGVSGAEGAIWLATEGESEISDEVRNALDEISREKPFIS